MFQRHAVPARRRKKRKDLFFRFAQINHAYIGYGLVVHWLVQHIA